MSEAVLADRERVLALSHVHLAVRPAVAAIWQLDEMLGRIVATTTEPIIGQMRLTWWHERLCALNTGERAAEPILGKLVADVLPHDVKGTDLAVLIDGWEVLLEPLPLNDQTLTIYAGKRGGALFETTATLLGGATSGLSGAGEGWALMDFALKCTDPVTAGRAVAMANERLRHIPPMRRPLRILARLARAKARRPMASAAEPLPRFVFLRAVMG